MTYTVLSVIIKLLRIITQHFIYLSFFNKLEKFNENLYAEL